ncbi:MAG: hypothetical protein ABIB93_03685 [Chloroflexota bacterium]
MIWHKLWATNRKQKGIMMAELIVGLFITGIITLGASMAAIQVIKSARATYAGANTVRGHVATIIGDPRNPDNPGLIRSAQEARPEGESQPTTPTAYIYDSAIIATGGNIYISPPKMTSYTVKAEPLSPYEGNIYADGAITLGSSHMSGGATIYGDATATGTITYGSMCGGSDIYGTVTPNLTPALVFGNISVLTYYNQAIAGGTSASLPLDVNGNLEHSVYITGNLNIPSSQTVKLNGYTVYVNGSITMSSPSGIQGPGTVVAKNNIALIGNLSSQPTNQAENIPLIMSADGGITVSGTTGWVTGVIYATNGTVTLSSNSRVYGSVIGKSITNSSSGMIVYPTALRSRS